MGIKAMNLTDKTGLLACHLAVDLDEDILLITDDGTIIRMRAKEISKISRDTRGVRMMKVKGEGQIVCVAKAKPYEEEEEGGEAAEG